MKIPPSGLLNWTSSVHWSKHQLPCRYCGETTNLRDSSRKAAHKTCAENALTQQAAEAVDAYQKGTL
ncbi:hypothetical protein [Streptomyces halobius]|uniref:Uncharacterized protein n=1 Tax=Streptomyces halobius TaxID=2879846 RepID=A0ABY4ME91_9ACTN|nr:hypothetical protein [Streptomyces halobius]UQA95722.1 hypothetical protein K9S39_31100 [Streptomyces halobius]